MSFELQQIWHHIEDSISPSEVQMVRQVMDIYTYEDSIDVNLGNREIFGLQFIARNLNCELGFIHEENKFKINISNLNWPYEVPSNPNKNPRKHVKLEIKYFTSIDFRKNRDKRSNFLYLLSSRGSLCAYVGLVEITWLIRPEFTIKLPLGLKMSKNNEMTMVFQRFYPVGSKFNCKRVYPYILQCDERSNLFVEEFDIDLKKPDVTRIDGKRLYTFVIDEDDYNNIILNTPAHCTIRFHGQYSVVYENRFIWVPIFGFILLPFVVLIVFQSIFGNNGDISQATVIVAVLSYFILFLTLKREEYEISLEKITKIVIGCILETIIIWIVVLILMGIYNVNSEVSSLGAMIFNSVKSVILSGASHFWSFLS